MSYFEFYFFFNGVKCNLNPLQIPPFYYIYIFYSLIHYLPSRFSNVLLVQCDGYWGRGQGLRQGFSGGRAGLQVGRALGCSGCLGLGSAVPVPHVPGHPTLYMQQGANRYLGMHV